MADVHVFYTLTDKGQKYALKHGLPAAKVQHLVLHNAPEPVVDMAAVSGDGSIAAVLLGYSWNLADQDLIEEPELQNAFCMAYHNDAQLCDHAIHAGTKVYKPWQIPSVDDFDGPKLVEQTHPRSVAVRDESVPAVRVQFDYGDGKLVFDKPITEAEARKLCEDLAKRIVEFEAAAAEFAERLKAKWAKMLPELKRKKAEIEAEIRKEEERQEEQQRLARLKAERQKAQYEAERKAWIEKHGSSRLRLALEAGMIEESNGVYCSERVAHELGDDWMLASQEPDNFEEKEVINPPEHLLRVLLDAQKNPRLDDVDVHYCIEDAEYGEEPRRFYRISAMFEPLQKKVVRHVELEGELDPVEA